MKNRSKTVLLLGDITGRSRVAVRMMTTVLEGRGREVLSLPTALISNTLNLGKHASLDTTQYLLDSLAVWEDLGVSYDFVCVGYVTGAAQAQALSGAVQDMRAKGRFVMLDPILGDGGKKYNSVTQEQLCGMRLLARQADLITPNLTEAALLCGMPYERAADGDACDEMISFLGGNGEQSVLITSAKTAGGGHAMIGFDAKTGERFEIRYDALPVSRGGTGDLFSALLTDGLLAGRGLKEAARAAGEAVRMELLSSDDSVLPELAIR